MNIYDYTPKHIKLSDMKKKARKYEGTFTELVQLMDEEAITLVTEDDGKIIGIWVDPKSENHMIDTLSGENFSRAYCSKPLMEWVEKIIEAKHKGKQITNINEETGKCLISSYNIEGEEYEFEHHITSSNNTKSLPEKVEIFWDELDEYGDKSIEQKIKKYLRDNYGHYLSGSDPAPKYIADPDSDIVYVSDIKWGRKISSTELCA